MFICIYASLPLSLTLSIYIYVFVLGSRAHGHPHPPKGRVPQDGLPQRLEYGCHVGVGPLDPMTNIYIYFIYIYICIDVYVTGPARHSMYRYKSYGMYSMYNNMHCTDRMSCTECTYVPSTSNLVTCS